MTIQEVMTGKLQSVGIPYRKIHVYGSQIVITAASRGAADKWVSVLGTFSHVRGMAEGYDDVKVNTGRLLSPKIHVWRVFARI